MTLPERLALAAWLAVNTPPDESQALQAAELAERDRAGPQLSLLKESNVR